MTRPIPTPDTGEIARRFLEWAEVDGPTSPLYEAMAHAAAADPLMLGILAEARPGQRRPVMLFAAVHDLLLRGTPHRLREWYPAFTDQPRRDDPGIALSEFCAEYRDELVTLVSSRSVQTNEVGRCLALLPALTVVNALAGGPVALVEVGASAGLNLAFDRYGYRYAGRDHDVVVGDPDAPVQLRSALVGDLTPPAPTQMPEVVTRIGIDLEPIDPGHPDDARWLRACIFAEQVERAARLDRALAHVAPDRPEVVAGDAVETLPAVAASLPDDVPVCLWHSWTYTYFPRPRRDAFVEAVRAVAQERPVFWLSFEAPGTAPAIPRVPAEEGATAPRAQATITGLARFRDGELTGRALARSHPHVTWLEWLDDATAER